MGGPTEGSPDQMTVPGRPAADCFVEVRPASAAVDSLVRRH